MGNLRIDGIDDEGGADYGSRGRQISDSDDRSKTAAAEGADGYVREGSGQTKSGFVRRKGMQRRPRRKRSPAKLRRGGFGRRFQRKGFRMKGF